MMFHAKDDPYIPWQMVDGFAKEAGIKLKLLARGGHLKTESVVQRHWSEIKIFLNH
jgi:predicted alpha/beta hydrolase family esterase